MASNRVFRAVALVAVLAALLVLYAVHPLAGWTTLGMLAVGTVLFRRRKEDVAPAD